MPSVSSVLGSLKTAQKQVNAVEAMIQNDHDSDRDVKPAAYAPAGTIPKARNLYEGKSDRRGRSSWTAEYPDDLEEPPENADSAQYALLIRKKKSYDGRKKLEIHSIVVQSSLLKKVLGVVLKDYPGIATNLERVEFSAPFQPFVHRWENFANAREAETDPETKEHLMLLWDVLEEELCDTIREKNDHVAHGVVRFDNIWTIFEPGVLVFNTVDGHDRVYKLKSGNFANTQCGRIYALATEYVDFDGERFGHGSTTLSVPEFGGTQEITRLAAFPLEHHIDKEGVIKHLLARGKKFVEYKGYHYKAYEGIALGQGVWGPIRYNVNSRIIIDTYAFNRFNPNRKISLGFLSISDTSSELSECDLDDCDLKDVKTTSQALTEEQLVTATSSLRGYSLKDKKWLTFYIDAVKEISWNEDAFASLVAPEEQKELILAFAQSQSVNRDRFDDVIQGKGRGIIMLLSGPPGVGKTLTAESVAETMKVPLYMMSAGDLGTEPSQVESALGNILEMNTKWNAVLLLDEADVFLEARSTHDLERNKLVSIFLRLLEYYEGILFLTTNRVDNIDAAFESRIHLSLQYDELDKTSRKHVWETFLGKAKGVGVFQEGELEKLADVQLNGRQIKNVLKTAQLLACKQDVPLQFGHVNTVLKLRNKNARKRNLGEFLEG
jgi:DNA polymerase III delta prime subunit